VGEALIVPSTAGPPECTTQDEELAVATGLPSQTQVIELLDSRVQAMKSKTSSSTRGCSRRE